MGGPLDGRTVEVDGGADEVVVEMTDRTRHRYTAGTATGRGTRTFTWTGRG